MYLHFFDFACLLHFLLLIYNSLSPFFSLKDFFEESVLWSLSSVIFFLASLFVMVNNGLFLFSVKPSIVSL